MPPKSKFTKSEIIEAALSIVRLEGFGALTARALGTKLGSSARPIFTIFKSMDEVQQEVVIAARQLYTEYVNRGLCQTEIPAFKGVGMQYIQFALDEPKLFQLLFMSEQPQNPDVMNVLPVIDDNYSQILSSVQNCFSLNQSDSEWVYRHLWIYSHGIAVLCATKMCTFTIEEIDKRLTEVCMAVLKEIKGGNRND
ncbi:MAG: TetR/AcrR family transcriptional regulator [Lachnospiraceae bacterium]|nr:TetR/AcrR family transcriptional regulator [Lachnospiraceae bacterium]